LFLVYKIEKRMSVMKKVTALFLVFVMIFVMLPVVTMANDDITVIVRGERVNFTGGQGPVVVDGRVLVPIRGVFEALDFDVVWDDVFERVFLRRLIYDRVNDDIIITIGSYTFSANGVGGRVLDVPAQIINGRTVVPIRNVLESVGYDLEWNSTTRTVTISSPIDRIISFTPFHYGIENVTNEKLVELIESGIIPANVTHLNLAAQQITDITPLYRLTSLVHLDLWGNNVIDATPLAGLTNLRVLDLTSNHFSDVSPLGNLTNLRELYLWGNPASFPDISYLESLINLRHFGLAVGSQFNGDISVLRNFTNLTNLYISGNSINDFSPIEDLVSLQALSIGGGSIVDISFLNNLPNLISLGITGGNIQDITPLSSLSRIRSISLSQMRNGDVVVGYLQNLPQLRAISISHMQNGDAVVRNLRNFVNLRELSLFNNQITDVTPLSRLTNLTELSITSNEITNVSPLGSLTNLERLFLSNNQITDVSPLLNLINLQTLFLNGNPIEQDQIDALYRTFPDRNWVQIAY